MRQVVPLKVLGKCVWTKVHSIYLEILNFHTYKYQQCVLPVNIWISKLSTDLLYRGWNLLLVKMALIIQYIYILATFAIMTFNICYVELHFWMNSTYKSTLKALKQPLKALKANLLS